MIAFQSLACASAALGLMPSTLLAATELSSDVQIQIVDANQLPVKGLDVFVSDSEGNAILNALDSASTLSARASGDAVTIVLPTFDRTLSVPLTDGSGTAITLQVAREKGAAAVTSVKKFQPYPTTALGVGTPANDDCANAIPIFDGDTAFSTDGATTDGTIGTNNNEIWYTYTATCDGVVTISTCNQADYDTDLILLTSDSCADQTALAINDDAAGCAGNSSLMTAGVTAGETYLLSVGGFGAGQTGSGTLSVSCAASAPNDFCDGAEAVAVGSSVTFSNVANSNSAGDPDFSCIFNGPGPGFGSTWFSFVAETSSALLDTSESTGSTDTVVGIYSGDCSNLVEIACGEDIDLAGGNFLTTVLATGLNPGEEYLVQVSTFNEASAGDITLSISNGPALEVCEGSGVNTATLSSNDALVIGQPWSAVALPAGAGRLAISFAGDQFLVPGLGEGLIDLNFVATVSSSDGNYSLGVPNDVSLVGQMIFFQAVAGDGTLTNALKGTVGM